MINRIKLTITVFANYLDDGMSLNEYAKYIMNYKKHNILDNYIKLYANSGFLKSILHSNKMSINTAYEHLNKSFLKQIKLDDFASSY